MCAGKLQLAVETLVRVDATRERRGHLLALILANDNVCNIQLIW